MKKLLPLFLLLFALPAAAQFRYGPQAGINVSTLNFRQKEILTVDQAVNPAANLNCEFIFTHFGLGIDFGLGYQMTGAFTNLQQPVWTLNGFSRERVMIHNLTIPLHLRFKYTKLLGVEDYIAPIVYGGPEFNIQVGHSANESNGQRAFKYSGGDVALSCGLGVELFKSWQLTAGYFWGVTYSLKATQLDDFSAKGQGWQIRLSYLF